MWLFVRVYYFLFRVQKKIVQWCINALAYSRIITEGFWLSVLSAKTITAIDNYHYAAAKKYLNSDFNLSPLFDWEEAMISKYFKECKSLMVLSAGGGREVVALLKKGFEVDGYECNHDLVEAGRALLQKEGFSSVFNYVPPDHAPVLEKNYDGIILGWVAYIHVRGRVARVCMLREINALLKPGAPFLISYWQANDIMDNYCKRVYKVAGFFSRIFRTRLVEKGTRLTHCSSRYFTPEEIKDELQTAGFEIVYQEPNPYGHAVAIKK